MNKIPDKGISDSWLRAFVATAQCRSFTVAAARLGVTQPAVSHAVARLEAAIGTPLLERSTTGVRLNVAGQALYDRAGAAFDEIDFALATVRGSDIAATISVSTSLATYWLLPRLPEFKRLHPTSELRVITTDTDRTVGRDDAHLWIPLGTVQSDELEATQFCVEEIVPVAAPSLAATSPNLDPAALLDAPLLHLEERYAPRFDWPRWFQHHGVATPAPLPGYRTNDYSLVVQGALEGQGIALGWMHIVQGLIASGRLVALATPVKTDQAFSILHRKDRPLTSAASAFRTWMTSVVRRPDSPPEGTVVHA